MTTKVKIPFGKGAMVEIEGTFDEVKSTIQKIDGLFESLNTALGEIASVAPPVDIVEGQSEPVQQVTTTDIPQIPIGVKKSLSESIVYLTKSSWGKQGRLYTEINDALEENTIYKSKNSLTGTLFTLSKGNKISRKKTGPGIMYYPPAY